MCSLSVGGGSLARELELAGAARTASRSSSALTEAVAALLDDDAERERASAAARRFAATRAWTTVTAPLTSWLREPRVDPGRLPFPAAASASSFWSRLARKRRRKV